jgi:hypothetical protein
MTVPTITVNESTEIINNKGTGAQIIAVIGDSGVAAAPTTIHTFNSYEEAVTAIGPEAETNPLLAAIKDHFKEGNPTDEASELGVTKVYAINVGSTPTPENFTDAMTTLSNVKDIELEEYHGLSTVTVLESIATHLDTLVSKGFPRLAIATVATGAEEATILLMTDDGETNYIQHSRVYIHIDRDMQAVFTAKVACTPYYENPAHGSYRSKGKADITEPDNPSTYVNAGFVCDWPTGSPLSTSNQAEPVEAYSTAQAAAEVPADAQMHVRRNADHQIRTICQMIAKYLKTRNVSVTRTVLEQEARGHLEAEVQASKLEAYTLNVKTNPQNVNGLILDGSVRPPGTIDDIIFNIGVEVSTGGV